MFSISFDSYCTGEVRGDSKVDGLPSYCQEKPSKKVGFSHLVVDNFYSMPSFYHAGFECFQECCESLDVEWTCRDNWLSYPYFVFLFGGASGSAKKQDSWHPSVQCINNKKSRIQNCYNDCLIKLCCLLFFSASRNCIYIRRYFSRNSNKPVFYFPFNTKSSTVKLSAESNPLLFQKSSVLESSERNGRNKR